MKGRTSEVLFAVMLFLLSLLFYPTKGIAGVDINIGINIPLPRVVISAPPVVVVVPGTYVYFAPDVEIDLLFYHGYWYRPYRGYWYRAAGYNGPWVYIAPKRLPGVLLSLPPDYRTVPPGLQRIPYGQLKKNWRAWEKERRWEGKEYERGERQRYKEEKWEHRGRGRGRGDD